MSLREVLTDLVILALAQIIQSSTFFYVKFIGLGKGAGDGRRLAQKKS
jgi:hypothetical protein